MYFHMKVTISLQIQTQLLDFCQTERQEILFQGSFNLHFSNYE